MATCGVITNSLLVVFTATALMGDSAVKWKWVVFVIMEHAVLLIKFGFALAVEDVPSEVQMQIDRQEHLVDKVIEHIADDDDELHIGRRGPLKMEILDHDNADGGFGGGNTSASALADAHVHANAASV